MLVTAFAALALRRRRLSLEAPRLEFASSFALTLACTPPLSIRAAQHAVLENGVQCHSFAPLP